MGDRPNARDPWLPESDRGTRELRAGLSRSRGRVLSRHGVQDPGLFRHQADHIEALIAAGEIGLAGEALDRFDEQGAATMRPWALATAARCRGLLRSAAGDLAGAVAALDAAVAAHETVDIPFEPRGRSSSRARSTAAGRRSFLARDALVKSVETFDRLGSRSWAERARAELGRVGSRKSDRHDLTVSEERVASLAASGLTNRVIAERAFLSPKTVEANLARVYQKLGINSRAQSGEPWLNGSARPRSRETPDSFSGQRPQCRHTTIEEVPA